MASSLAAGSTASSAIQTKRATTPWCARVAVTARAYLVVDADRAERPDRPDEVVGGRAMGRPGGGDDVLLDHDRAEVVRSELERDLADLHPLRDPARLDVVDVVEVDARDRLGQQVVERGRHRLARHPRAEPVAVVLERPG